MEPPKFMHPFTALIGGCTKSGKTEFTKKFVACADHMMTPAPQEIIWCYSEYQPGYEVLLKNPKVKLVEGLPCLQELKETASVPKLLVLDDLLMEGNAKNSGITQLFIKGAHHYNVSCIHIVQNIFYGSLRTARINSHYLVLMRNPSDKLQVMQLARQLFPGQHGCLMEAYKDATIENYGYLLVDVSPEIPEKLRLRTNIFPDEYQVVYVPKGL